MTPRHREDPVADYVRKLLNDWVGEGKQLKQLAKEADVVPSLLTQIRKGQGVGKITLPKLAPALGRTVPALIAEAYDWYEEHGRKLREAVREEPAGEVEQPKALREAVEILKTMKGPVTEDEIAASLSAFDMESLADRDVEFWVTTLGADLEWRRKHQVLENELGRVEKVAVAERGRIRRRAANKRANAHKERLRKERAAKSAHVEATPGAKKATS